MDRLPLGAGKDGESPDCELGKAAAAEEAKSNPAAGKKSKSSKAQAEKLSALKARKKELHGQLGATRVTVSPSQTQQHMLLH